MSRPRRDRVSTEAGGSASFQPFAQLDVAGLPSDPEESKPSQKSGGRVVLRREVAHRRGKPVTVIDQWPESVTDREIDELAGRLKTLCGAGGSTDGRRIEIQGEHFATVRKILEVEGYTVAGER